MENEVEEEINNKETVRAARERMHRYPFNNVFFYHFNSYIKTSGSEMKCLHSKAALNFLFVSQR